jgi:hypothetical protein
VAALVDPFLLHAESVLGRRSPRFQVSAALSRQEPVSAEEEKLEFLRQLIADDHLSLERTYDLLLRYHFRGRAAASTVEALMFGLRERGTEVLQNASARRRIGELSEQQLHEVCGRLQKLKPRIAKAWSDDEIERLVEAWTVLHA